MSAPKLAGARGGLELFDECRRVHVQSTQMKELARCDDDAAPGLFVRFYEITPASQVVGVVLIFSGPYIKPSPPRYCIVPNCHH